MIAAAPAAFDPADVACAERIVQRSGTSFFWGMRLLPPPKRAAMYAIYAFCREVDDIADDDGAAVVKSRRLAEWREEIERVYAGAPRLAVARALRPSVARFDLRKDDFIAVIDGMEMDAGGGLRIRDTEHLRLYCDRVACAVGRLSVRVFGVDQPIGDRLADALGRALQLTNILRDLEDDARRDRLYLPADLLGAHGIGDTEPRAVLRHPALGGVCEAVAATAADYFHAAEDLIGRCRRREVRPARIMMEVYKRTLRRLVARGWQRWGEPVSLSPGEKLWVALRYGVI
jgi:phytoene synthase